MAYYVNMVDKFLSGWGPAARGKSRYSVRCETIAQAEAILASAHRRNGMQYAAIADRPARCGPRDHQKIIDFAELGESWKQFYDYATDAELAR